MIPGGEMYLGYDHIQGTEEVAEVMGVMLSLGCPIIHRDINN